MMKHTGITAHRRIIAAGITAALLALTVPAVHAAPPQDSKSATLRIGMTQYPSTLHPLYDAMVAKSLVLGATLRPMTAYTPEWTASCILCTELPSYANGRARKVTLPNGKKGIEARYTLKDDLFWADGVPVTSDDVALTYDVGRHPKAGVSNHTFYAQDIAQFKKVDDKNFVITFAKEACEFASINDVIPLPAHLERAVFEKDPATYQNRSLYVTAPTTKGLWAGPYRVARIDAGSLLALSRNEHWHGTQPAFENIGFRVIENTSAMASSLLAGQIDYIAGELGLPLDQAIGFEKRLPAGAFTVTYKPGLTYEHIDLPTDQPPFNDIRLRKALMHAMNRDIINDKIFSGQQPVANANISPLDTVYNPATQTYPYDPARAAELFDDAGWHMGNDGLRRNDKGDVLRLTLSTTAGNLSREVVQQVIQSDWRKAGVDVVIKNQPPRVLFGETLRKRLFDGGVIYAWMASPRNIPKTTMHSSMIPTADNGYAGQNHVAYASKDADKTIDDLSVVCGTRENQALWNHLQDLYAQDLPALPLFFRAEAFFIPAWLAGVTPTGHMHPSTLWIENWRINQTKEHP